MEKIVIVAVGMIALVYLWAISATFPGPEHNVLGAQTRYRRYSEFYPVRVSGSDIVVDRIETR